MPKRIFWLGMHKVLTKTELPRLRTLGYEVFNPPYLSSVKDQSACLEWDADQPTTLPKNVFQALSKFNFFYNEIPADIAKLLNDYFDAVVVTISPRWLRSILGVYKGTVIYRTYGQHYALSDELKREGLLLEIANRNNFVFMPHAEEALYGEHSWLKDIAVVSPYCLPSDILQHEGSWGKCDRRANEIIITCPNIDNPFFREHYQFLKKNFSEKHFLYYGVQISDVDDPQVVGTLAREKLIARFRRAAGYLYTYTDPRVCYLPPIEMMVLGGPVLFLKGSLLDRYFGEDAPGRCLDIRDAKEKIERLLVGDKSFIHAIILSQDSVKRRYLPDFVWPHFDKVIVDSLESNKEPSHWLTVDPASKVTGKKRIYLLHHFPGAPVIFDGESYAAYDGIPRVMRQIAQTLNKNCDHEIIITARYDQAEMFRGFFASLEPIKIISGCFL
ncbi:hypothetical protein [Nitrospina watsonii]|nr:hypothetical protein [Nitrospina watsonii]